MYEGVRGGDYTGDISLDDIGFPYCGKVSIEKKHCKGNGHNFVIDREREREK